MSGMSADVEDLAGTYGALLLGGLVSATCVFPFTFSPDQADLPRPRRRRPPV